MALRLLIISLLLAVFAWGVWRILQTDVQPRQQRPPAQPPIVQVMSAEAADHLLRIEAFGVIQAAQVLTIRSQVGGQLLAVHPRFAPGERIPAGETLYTVDPTDYKLTVETALAAVDLAKAEVALEQGKHQAADKELQLLQGAIPLSAQSRALVLRKPQLRQARAKLRQAQNSLTQAQIDLQRTQASLSDDVIVLEQARVVGEVIGAQDVLGKVALADQYQAQLHVPQHLIRRIKKRTPTRAGSIVHIQQGEKRYQAEVIQVSVELDPERHMVEVVAEFTDLPVDHIPLIGGHLRAEIEAGMLPNTVAAPYAVWRDNQRIWLVDDEDALLVRQIKPIYLGVDQVYFPPFRSGERILLGNLDGLLPGLKVRPQHNSPRLLNVGITD